MTDNNKIRTEDIPSDSTIKGGYQEVTPEPSPPPADEGEWGTATPSPEESTETSEPDK